jgi:hypothetical protein
MTFFNNPIDLKLDLDIAAFKLEDLVQNEIYSTTQEILIQRQIELLMNLSKITKYHTLSIL